MITRRRLLTSSLFILVLLAAARPVLAESAGASWPFAGGQSQAARGHSLLQEPLGTAFTYQGRLVDEDRPANGIYDFRFALSDSATESGVLGQSVQVDDVEVVDGYFTVVLDFGDFYDGTALWLRVAMRPDGEGVFTELLPRQPLTAAPLASYASQTPWSGLLDMPEEFADGQDNNTTYEPGAGLSLNIRRFDVVFGGSGSELSAARSDHDHYGQEWEGSGEFNGLRVTNDTIGIMGVSNQGTGIWGQAAGTSGNLIGVFGQSNSADGVGVRASNEGAGGGADLELGGQFGDLYSDRNADKSHLRFFSEDAIYLLLDRDNDDENASFNIVANSASQAAGSIFRVDEDGDVFADGGYNCGVPEPSGIFDALIYQSDPLTLFALNEDSVQNCLKDATPADFAEMLPVAGDQELEAGDVLVIGPEGELTRSSEAYQAAVVGVYSTRPSYLGNAQFADDDGYAPLALVGLVPVKASAENGAVQPGDLLVSSSTPGHAMRGGENPPQGIVIGKALEPLDEETGIILMLAMLQ